MSEQSGLPGTDEVLKQMASESVRQGENMRNVVRDMTLQALKARELNLAQIRSVLQSVTEGVSLGAAKAGIGDGAKAMRDAVAGMDDALTKAVHASHLALQQLTSQGQQFNETYVSKALDDLRRLEGEFMSTVKSAAEAGGGQFKEQWQQALQHFRVTGTDTGASVADTVEEFTNRMSAAVHQTRVASVQSAQALAQNFATLASGILIGLSEALNQHRSSPDKGKK